MDIFEVIPVSQNASKNAIQNASNALKKNKLLAIFPEGAISSQNQLGDFQKGAILLSKTNNVKIIPFGINGLWGSRFSRSTNKTNKFEIRRKIVVNFGKENDFENETELKNAVQALLN